MPILRTSTHTYGIEVIAYDDGVYEATLWTHGRPKLACVTLLVDGHQVVLQNVSYYEECSMDRALERGSGTIDMLKASLRFVLASFPTVHTVELSDETFVPTPGRPLITARRLLLGMPGWYEEHVGAVPTARTRLSLAAMRARLRAHPDVRAELDAMSDQPDQFTAGYVASVCARLDVRPSVVMSTTWAVPVETVLSWAMPVVVQAGGGSSKRPRRATLSNPYDDMCPAIKAGYK